MRSEKAGVVFRGTSEQETELKEALSKFHNQEGTLMPALQAAQHIYGYLPIEVQKMIADKLGIRLEEVYGVATFYSQFTLSPKGKYNISVCLGTACYVKGTGEIFDKLVDILGIQDGESTEDGQFSLEACRCIGACGLAPVLTVNDDVYGRLTINDLEDIIKKYKTMEV